MPPQPLIYSLSNSKLGTLREFIDEHLNIGFIQPSRSSHGAPILFVKEGWIVTALCGFPKPEQGYKERPLPTTTHHRLIRCTMEGQNIH